MGMIRIEVLRYMLTAYCVGNLPAGTEQRIPHAVNFLHGGNCVRMYNILRHVKKRTIFQPFAFHTCVPLIGQKLIPG